MTNKYEPFVWYDYSEQSDINIVDFRNNNNLSLVFAYKTWNKHTDKFEIKFAYDPFYSSNNFMWLDRDTSLPIDRLGKLVYFSFMWKVKYEYDDFIKLLPK